MQDKLTKQTVMELTLSEQLRERQEMEKKLQKLAKTMDYLERAKREEAAPLVEAAYQQRLVEEKALHEHEQQVFLRFCLWRFFFSWRSSILYLYFFFLVSKKVTLYLFCAKFTCCPFHHSPFKILY
jgi:hypothetical protein